MELIESILGETDGGRSVFEHYGLPIGLKILSPLNPNDTKPGFNVYFDEKSKMYRYKDFGEASGQAASGDAINFVMELHQVTFRKAIEKIVTDLKLNINLKKQINNMIMSINEFTLYCANGTDEVIFKRLDAEAEKDEVLQRYTYYDPELKKHFNDAIDYAATVYNVERELAILLLLKMFAPASLNKKDLWKHKELSNNIYDIILPKNTILRINKKYPDDAAAFWMKYGITGSIIKKFSVLYLDVVTGTSFKGEAPKRYTIHTKSGNPTFIYLCNEGTYKLYTPFSEKHEHRFRHIGNKKAEDFIFGFDQLPQDTLNYLIIVGGEKDALTLTSLGYYAVAVNNEASKINSQIKAKLISKVNDSKLIFIFYDKDATGISNSIELGKKTGFSVLLDFIPEGLVLKNDKKVKDISDYVNYFIERKDHLGLQKMKADLMLSLAKINEGKDWFNAKTLEYHTPGIANPIVKKFKPEKVKRIRTGNERLRDASNQPAQLKLVGDMIFAGTINFLFGDTGTGKSLWALHLANALSKGDSSVFGLPSAGVPLNVLLYDLELPDKTFESRYKGHVFSDNLKIANAFQDLQSGQFDFNQLVRDIKAHDTDVLIIDNITFMSEGANTEIDVAKRIMESLKKIRDEHGTTIIVIGHTPKIASNSLTHINQLGGSKYLSNFADTVIALATSSKGLAIRYLKQLKFRNSERTEVIYVYKISQYDNFIHFDYTGESFESDHISKKGKETEVNAIKKEAIKLFKEGKLSYGQIGEKLNVAKSTIGLWGKEFKDNNISDDVEAVE